ncbi:flagellar basal body rod protein FlgB [Ramlibacter sp.]|uniref:flagellar basal body rod protein FlgB n=1 Tax=Ramlibacter sp. TaxID=1917967 RepID=UPI003D0F83E4
MTPSIESITTSVLGLALDAAAMRQQAIAANIANASVPGYAPSAVSFDDQLEDARRALQGIGRLDAASLQGVQPALRTLASPNGEPLAVQLDGEAAQLAQNSVHFQALLKGLAKHYALLSTAVGDGRK